ncbi:5'-nucleotidase C-terminal domain-containing protein [Erysipelothrix sp. P66]|uniref:5'-nucleotidase C-terminal domain-containing protein n=1 Tax=Erysipelothrix sp. P66 TaxID=3141531 RepID=UPI00315D06E5
MMKKPKIVLLVLSLLTLITPGSTVLSVAADTSIQAQNTVTIMHTNDMHGRFGTKSLGLAHIKTLKDEINPLLLVDGGDAFQGLPISNVDKGASMAKIMNAVGYDAMVVGNHEFDFGTAVALGEAEGFGSNVKFPVLSSNTVYTESNQKVFKESTLISKPNSNAALIEKDGYKIAVIGATTPETQTKTHPKNIEGISWLDPIPTVTHEILKEDYQDVDFYVVLTHLGIDNETKNAWRSDTLAQSLSENSSMKDKKILIVDGHSHTPIENGIHVGDNVILVQTGEHLNNVGLVTLNLDDFGSSVAKLIPLKDIANQPDPEIMNIIQTSDAAYSDLVSKVIKENNMIEFQGQRDWVRVQETNLGNIITDSMVAYGKEGFKNPTDFAVINGGGIRANLSKGPITLGDVISVLPFGNVMAQISVNGRQVWDMFEFSLRTDVQDALDNHGLPKLGSNGGFLHVSDTIRIHYDPTKDASSRVLGIEIYDANQDQFVPIDFEKTYYMATNDFLAAGGDGYSMLGGAREEGPSLDAVFADFIEHNAFIDWGRYDETQIPQRIISILEKDYASPGVSPLEFGALEQILDKAKAIKANDYTEESFQNLQDAIAIGESYLQTLSKRTASPVSQADINKAIEQIEAAIANLKLKDMKKPIVVPKKPETPGIGTKDPILSSEQESLNISTLPKTGINNRFTYGLGSGLTVLGWIFVRGIHKKKSITNKK